MSTPTPSQSRIIRSNQYLSDSLGFITKEKEVVKNGCTIKMAIVDLTPYLHEEMGFIDPDFPHVASSVSEITEHKVVWRAAEELVSGANYSQSIVSLEHIQFHRKSIVHALLVMNWLTTAVFEEIFVRQINTKKLYEFDVMVNGVFLRLPIDSYVPIHQTTGKQLFTQISNNAIFPCLYEKMLAKVYGNYESITTDMIDIVELQTMYCRQEIAMNNTRAREEYKVIIQMALENKAIVSFRTRTSIQLESFGLEPNAVYILTRVLPYENSPIVEFLEMDGEKWIGKYGKIRSQWRGMSSFIAEHELVLHGEFRQNYMLLSDLCGLSRELIVLHNTNNYNKTYCESNQKRCHTFFLLDVYEECHVMLKLSFRNKKCYNSLLLMHHIDDQFTLVEYSFVENKEHNFLETRLPIGEYYLVVYNETMHGSSAPFVVSLFSSLTKSYGCNLVQLPSKNSRYEVMEKAFIKYFQNEPRKDGDDADRIVRTACLYKKIGLAFVVVDLQQQKCKVKVNIDLQELAKNKIYPLNDVPTRNGQQVVEYKFNPGKMYLFMFKCFWRRKDIVASDNIDFIKFPPYNSITVRVRK